MRWFQLCLAPLPPVPYTSTEFVFFHSLPRHRFAQRSCSLFASTGNDSLRRCLVLRSRRNSHAETRRRRVSLASRCFRIKVAHSAQQRYAQIEKEAYALSWACDRFSDYLLGMDFHIVTDHKPLVPLLSPLKCLEYLSNVFNVSSFASVVSISRFLIAPKGNVHSGYTFARSLTGHVGRTRRAYRRRRRVPRRSHRRAAKKAMAKDGMHSTLPCRLPPFSLPSHLYANGNVNGRKTCTYRIRELNFNPVLCEKNLRHFVFRRFKICALTAADSRRYQNMRMYYRKKTNMCGEGCLPGRRRPYTCCSSERQRDKGLVSLSRLCLFSLQ